MLETLTACALGAVVGLRHALEPDHLAAVSTLVATRRNGFERAMLGARWGLGHTLALVGVGALVIALRWRMPEALERGFELAVAMMLLALGIRALLERPSNERDAKIRGAPLLVGFVHGLAGSGALTVIAVAAMPSLELSLLYIALFGIGSIVGMAALSMAIGWPLERFIAQPRVARRVGIATGIVSASVGVVWGVLAFTGA